MNVGKNQQYLGDWAAWLADHWTEFAAIGIVALIAYFAGTRLITFVIRRAVKGARHRSWHKKDVEKRQKTLVNMFTTMWRIVIVFSIGYAILKVFVPNVNSTLAPLFASAGIVGIALGFGAQSLIKDFLSGIFIISENQYRVGDIIDIEGFSGTVERIGTRSTVMRDVEGQVHYFPNGMIQHVINKTMGFSMARFTVLLHPETDVDNVSEIIDAVGKALAEEDKWKDKILEPPAFVSVGEITGNSIEAIVAGKTQPSDQWSVVAEMRRRLLEEFEQKGLRLAVTPFPVQASRR